MRSTIAAICLLLACTAQTGYAQDATLAPPPPPADPTAAAAAATTPPPPPVVATPPPPPPPTAVPAATTAPAPQAPAVTAAPAVAAPPPVQPPPPVVTAAPAPQAVATPPVTAAPVVVAAPAPKAVATPPVTAAPVVVAAPAPKAVATPPVTAAPVAKAAPVAAPTVTPVAAVAKAAPAPAPVATPAAKAAPAPAPSSAAVLPGVLPFPRAPTPAPAPAPAAPPRQCSNGQPRCKVFIEDTLCCGNAEGLVTDNQYLHVDVLCTESVVIPTGCLTVTPTLPNITVNPTFVPAGVSSTFHNYIVDFQNDGNFVPGPFSGAVTVTLEALRNASSPNYNPTCAQAISPCLYNGTLYNQTLPTFPVSVTVLDPLDYVEGYIGLPPSNTDTLGFSVNATNPAICGQADIGALSPSFYTGGFVNYTGFQNACNTTRTVLDTYQFCEDYTIPAENRTLRNLPPAPPAPRVPGPSLGPSSRDGIRLF